jgi:DNA-binding NarL/FixJ family response regulator
VSKKISVILIDDHAVVRDGLRHILASTPDIEVLAEAQSALQAVQLVRERAFDVAMVDIALPDRNGLELTKLLRAERPGMAVLVLSMYSEEIYAVRALKHGAAGYMTKNSPAATVIAAVRKVAAGGRHVNPQLVEHLASEISGVRRAGHEELSDREIDVLRLIASGKSLVEIAKMLHLSPKTVTTYRTRIVDKTGLHSNAELARYALDKGLIA